MRRFTIKLFKDEVNFEFKRCKACNINIRGLLNSDNNKDKCQMR